VEWLLFLSIFSIANFDYCQTPNIDYLSVKLHVLNRVSICIFVYYAEEENDASGFTLNLKVRIIFIIVTFK